jgi:histidine triad (HIT) family protein
VAGIAIQSPYVSRERDTCDQRSEPIVFCIAFAIDPTAMEKTLFQKIADGEIPADILFEDEQCLALRDINAQAPVHFLVVPRKPIARPDQIGPDDEALVGHLFVIAGKVAREQGLSDYRLVMNNGAEVGQSVFHIHLHVLGGRKMTWPPG